MNVVTGSGSNWEPLTHLAVDGNDTAVTITRPVKSFSIMEKTRTKTLQVRRIAASAGFDLIFPGQRMIFPINIGVRGGSTPQAYTVAQVRTDDGSDATVIIVVTY